MTNEIYQTAYRNQQKNHFGNEAATTTRKRSIITRNIRQFSKRKSKEKSEIPACIEQALLSECDPNMQDMINQLKEGNIFIKHRHRRWSSERKASYCRLDEDLLYFRHSYMRCGCILNVKKQDEKKVDIRQILMIRNDREPMPWLTSRNKPYESFSLVLENSTLKYVSLSSGVTEVWVKVLEYLIQQIRKLQPRLQHELMVWELFSTLDIDQDGHVTYNDVDNLKTASDLCLCFECQEHWDYSEFMTYAKFNEFYKMTTRRPEIDVLFQNISADKCFITSRELYKFLQTTQGEDDVTEFHCEKITNDYEQNEQARDSKKLTPHGFNLYLKSKKCDLFNWKHDEVSQNMRQPLSHYYIASSHNTYLTGDQLKDPSSIDSYISALLKGCKCVELDCWDGPSNEPTIYHGYTLTSKIKFKDVIEVISRYAFAVSDFPLILSIENHCSITQQKKMAYYLKMILGSELLRVPIIRHDKEGMLPSPIALKGKILLKGKKLPSVSESNVIKEPDDVSDEDESLELKKKQKDHHLTVNANGDHCFNRNNLIRNQFQNISVTSQTSNISSQSENNAKLKRRLNSSQSSNNSSTYHNSSSKTHKLARSLSDLIIYCKSVKFESFKTNSNPESHIQMSSFGESKALRLAKTNTEEAILYHQHQLSRTYPAGFRTDSSNYNPLTLWNAGFQMVALNYQTKCDEMDIHYAMFRQNGNCGYVLKPMCQRTNIDLSTPKKLTLTFISSHGLNAGIADSNTSVEIWIMIPNDDNLKREIVLRNRGSTSKEKCAFYIKKPELTFVKFLVKDRDKSSDRISHSIIAFASISQGYRHISFLNRETKTLNGASLFVFVEIEDLSEYAVVKNST